MGGKLFPSYRKAFKLVRGLWDSKTSDMNCLYEALVHKEAWTIYQDRVIASFLCVLSLSSDFFVSSRHCPQFLKKSLAIYLIWDIFYGFSCSWIFIYFGKSQRSSKCFEQLSGNGYFSARFFCHHLYYINYHGTACRGLLLTFINVWLVSDQGPLAFELRTLPLSYAELRSKHKLFALIFLIAA